MLFFKNWINNTLSRTEILLQKIEVPNNPSFIRSIEQWVIDLLADNDSNKTPSSHSNCDAKL